MSLETLAANLMAAGLLEQAARLVASLKRVRARLESEEEESSAWRDQLEDVRCEVRRITKLEAEIERLKRVKADIKEEREAVVKFLRESGRRYKARGRPVEWWAVGLEAKAIERLDHRCAVLASYPGDADPRGTTKAMRQVRKAQRK